jgi:hypothetical protein
VRRARVSAARAIRTVGLLARDERIPRSLRALVVIGLLPIPGPVDEAILLLIAPLLYVFAREPVREAWRRAA